MIQTAHLPAKHSTEFPTEVRTQFALSEVDRLDPPPDEVAAWLGDCASEAQLADLEHLLAADRPFRWRLGRLLKAASEGDQPDAARVRLNVRQDAGVRIGAGILGLFDHLDNLHSAGGGCLDWGAFGHRCLSTACAAVRLARATNQAPRALEAFGAGLLHDLGVIGLCCLFPRGFGRIVRRYASRPDGAFEVERAVLGVDRCEFGDRMARCWGLPGWLVASAGAQRGSVGSPGAVGPNGALTTVVGLADLIARERTRHWGAGRCRADGVEPGLAGLTWDDVEALSIGLADDVNACISIVAGSSAPAWRHGAAGSGSAESLVFGDRVLADTRKQRNGNRERAGVGKRAGQAKRTQSAGRAPEAYIPTDPSVDTSATMRSAEWPRDRFPSRQGAAAPGPIAGAGETTCVSGDACGILAKAAGRALDIDGPLIVFRLDRSGSFCQFAESDSTRASTSIVRVSPAGDATTLVDRMIMQLPAWLWPVSDRLQQRISQASRPAALLLAPMVHDGRLIGGVLFGSPDNPVKAATVNAAWLLHHDLFASLVLANALSSASQRGLGDRSPASASAPSVSARESREWLTRIASVASGAAHELNTPLAVISGRAQLLSTSITDERQRKALDTIVAQTALASELVSDLLAVGSPAPPSVRPFSLLLVLEQMRVNLLAERSMSPGMFAIQLADPGVSVLGDAEQLKQILAAVLNNAIEHGGDKNVRIVVNSASRASDDTVVLSVADNGRGMAPEVLARARDPFFSVQGSSRGRGLGLARAYSLALNNGGDLWIESRPGQGTAVFIALPSDRGSRL